MKKESAFSFIFKYAKKRKLFFIFSILLAILKVGFETVPYFLLPDILTNLVEGNKDINFYLIRFGIILGLLIISLILRYISTSLSHSATFSALANIRKDMLTKLSKMSLGDIEDISTGSIKNIVVERVDSIETTMAHVIPEATSALVGAITLVVYLVLLSYQLRFGSLLLHL